MEGSDVEPEQISRNSFYPYPHPYPYPYPLMPYYFPPPDPNWYYPYAPVPRFYYCPEYDSQMYKEYWNGGYYPPPIITDAEVNRNKAMSMPNIIVTPTTEDEDNKVHVLSSTKKNIGSITIDDSEQNTLEGKESALDMLSKKLNEISVKPELDMNISKDDKTYVGDNGKDLINSPSPVSNEKASTYDNNSDDAQSSDEDTSTSSSSRRSGKEHRRFSSSGSKEGLQAIKSVTDINVYNTDEDEKDEITSDDHKFVPIQNEMEKNANENVDDFSDRSYSADFYHEDVEGRQLKCEEYVSDECDEITEDDVALGLSVIYEESEFDGASKRRADSHTNTASTFSDCSTTIANDIDEDDSENELNAIEEIEDENPSLVTVRLPLKLSFSRSSNNENITTVVVGDSEIEDDQSNIISRESSESIDEETNKQEDTENEQNIADVSVTFSLSSNRSGSFDHRGFLSKTPSADSEISVSVSLPMMRDKFSIKSISGDTTNDISTISSNSSSSSTDDEKDNEKEEFVNDIAIDSIKEPDVKIDRNKEETEREEQSEHSPDECKIDTIDENAYQMHKRFSNSSWNWGSTNKENDEMTTENPRKDEIVIKEMKIHSSETDKITQIIDSNMKMCENIKECEENEIEDENKTKNKYNLENDFEEESTSESYSECSKDDDKSDSKEAIETENKEITLKTNINWEQKSDYFGEVIDEENEAKGRIDEDGDLEEDSDEEEELPVKETEEEEDEVEELEKEEDEGEQSEEQESEEEESGEEESEEEESGEEQDEKKDKGNVGVRKDGKGVEGVRKEGKGIEGREIQEKKIEIEIHEKKDEEGKEQHGVDEFDDFTESELKDETQTPVNDESANDVMVSKFNFPVSKIEDKEIINADGKQDSNEVKVSVRDCIAIFEAAASESLDAKRSINLLDIALNNTSEKKKTLSRNSSLQRSESELEEDDSGVTDMSKPMSETDTDPECFTELRKMTRYQRAATHSRLFKLLQEESSLEEKDENETNKTGNQHSIEQGRKKIIHNVSITRRTNPEAIKDTETMLQRRERLSLPLKKTNSIDADNLSTSNSPSSPTSSCAISDKLVNELVQSLLLKKKSRYLRNLPMEKLQAAAKRVLEEDLDSLESTSLESTPALTPQENKTDSSNMYDDYYDSWKTNLDKSTNNYNILPSKAFKNLQEQSVSGQRKPWAARCPRVLSSKTINRDLTRVTESPEMYRSSSVTRNTPENSLEFPRGGSLSRLGKV